MQDSISDKLANFIMGCDLHIDYFYKSLSKEELEQLRNESVILKDFDTVKVIDKETDRRNFQLRKAKGEKPII